MSSSLPSKIVCINLDHRPDRWESVSEQFRLHHLTVERFAAVDAQQLNISPIEAFTRSHLQVIEKARDEKADSILIFEDDAVLHRNFSLFLRQSWAHMPADWDILYLGGSHREKPLPVNAWIMRVQNTLTTHAYILRNTMFEKLIYLLKDTPHPADVVLANIQKDHQCFVTNPPIAWQKSGYSDIEGMDMNYPWIKTNQQ